MNALRELSKSDIESMLLIGFIFSLLAITSASATDFGVLPAFLALSIFFVTLMWGLSVVSCIIHKSIQRVSGGSQ